MLLILADNGKNLSTIVQIILIIGALTSKRASHPTEHVQSTEKEAQ